MVNYYHRFIPQCAAKLTPLNDLLTAANEGHTRLSPKSNFDLKWDQNAESALVQTNIGKRYSSGTPRPYGSDKHHV